MSRTFLSVALATAFLAVGAAAPSAMPRLDKPSAQKLVEPVVCSGNRKNYRDFDHCMQMNSRTANVSTTTRYCSRICR